MFLKPQMEAYIDSLTAPKRRPHALPLLPVGASSGSEGGASDTGGGYSDDASSGRPHAAGSHRGGSGRQQKQRHTTIGDDDSDGSGSGGSVGGSTLVSMLLPTRNVSAQQAGNLTALDQVPAFLPYCVQQGLIETCRCQRTMFRCRRRAIWRHWTMYRNINGNV